jgi:ammonium transporter, Amt family
MVQIIGIATVALLSFVGTVIIVKIIQATSGLRVSESQEINEGLDFGSHGESSYNL